MGGIMQLGFGPGPDGCFHPNVLYFFEELGDWLKTNGEGIYGTRPVGNMDSSNRDGIFFTRSRDHKMFYVFVTRWPGSKLELDEIIPEPGSQIEMAGFDKPLGWTVDGKSLIINLPDELKSKNNRLEEYAWLIKIKNGIPHN